MQHVHSHRCARNCGQYWG